MALARQTQHTDVNALIERALPGCTPQTYRGLAETARIPGRPTWRVDFSAGRADPADTDGPWPRCVPANDG